MRLVDVGDATIAVHEWGDPAEPTVLFWHALGLDASGRTIEVGRAAHRRSGLPRRRLGRAGVRWLAAAAVRALPAGGLAQLAHRLIATLDLELLVFMGHSWGGAIAVRYAAAHPSLVRAVVLLDSGHIDYCDLPDVDPDRPSEEWVAEAAARDPRLAEARGTAMHGLTDRVSDAWPVLAAHGIPTLLLLATVDPHGTQNREHVGEFEQALPQAEVRWIEGAGHGLLDDVGPPLGDEIGAWLQSRAA